MANRVLELPNIQNVAIGSTALFNPPTGPTYDLIGIRYTNLQLSELQNIRCKVNGQVVQEFSDGVRLDEINQYHGRNAANSGILWLHLMRREFLEIEDQEVYGWGTNDVQTLSVEISIPSSIAGSNPDLSAFALWRPEPQNLGLITKIREFPRSFATGGWQEIDSLPGRGMDARIAAIHLYKSDVDAVELVVNSDKEWDGSKTDLHELVKQFDKVPQPGKATHLDFGFRGILRDFLALKNVQYMRVRMNLGSAGTVTAVVEYADGLQGV